MIIYKIIGCLLIVLYLFAAIHSVTKFPVYVKVAFVITSAWIFTALMLMK